MILRRPSWDALKLAVEKMASGTRLKGGAEWDHHARNLEKVAQVIGQLRDRDAADVIEPDSPALLRDERSRATLDSLLERLTKGH